MGNPAYHPGMTDPTQDRTLQRGGRKGRHRREVDWVGQKGAQNARAKEEERVRRVFIRKPDVACLRCGPAHETLL